MRGSCRTGDTSRGSEIVDEPAEKTGRQPRQVIRVFLKYGPHGEKVITGLERISRPGRRVYLGVEDVPQRARRAGHQHPDDVARCDDRPRRHARRASAAKCSATCGEPTRMSPTA